MKPFIVTLTGPSCAGKSTLEQMLVDRHGFKKAVSTTTRKPRSGEVEGEDYYFVEQPRFLAMKEAGELIESVGFDGGLYGVTAREVERIVRTERPIVVVCEPGGRDQIADYCRRNGWGLHRVFVCNPDEVIAARFLTRCFINESRNNLSAAIVHVEDHHARRLATMMTIERAWIAEAFYQINNDGWRGVYDRILTEFNSGNDALVAEGIAMTFADHKYSDELLAA